MRRILILLVTSLFAMSAAVLFAAGAQASQPPTGGGPYDHRGYEIRNPSTNQPFCLTTFGGPGAGVTTGCNYFDSDQQWWANRQGNWSSITSYANGHCLTADSSSHAVGLLNSTDCTSYFSQWSRTSAAQWKNRGTGECLAGRYVPGQVELTVRPCSSTYIERWIVTG